MLASPRSCVRQPQDRHQVRGEYETRKHARQTGMGDFPPQVFIVLSVDPIHLCIYGEVQVNEFDRIGDERPEQTSQAGSVKKRAEIRQSPGNLVFRLFRTPFPRFVHVFRPPFIDS